MIGFSGTGKFLSTPSARRATGKALLTRNIAGVSIHALREEGDWQSLQKDLTMDVFLSTPSARRATRRVFLRGAERQVSIHALREEGDQCCKSGIQFLLCFYPRPPRGGRHGSAYDAAYQILFLSTPSARRATAKTERKPSAFVSLYTALHKLQRGAFKTNRKITPLLTQTAGIPVRSVQENHVRFLFALAGYQKISTLSCANSGCSPTCSTLVW